MYFRMTNSDERRNSTKSITQKIMLCFPQVSQCTELTDVRGTSNMLNNVFLLMYQMRRRVLSFSIYSEKVKNNMSQKRKRESIVCFTPISSKNYIETSK